MISKQAVQSFLNRNLKSWEWMKTWSPQETDLALNKLEPPPVFTTMPMQHQKICFLLGTLLPECLFFLDMGSGKAQPNECPVLTPEGWKPIGEMKVGDKVLTPTGETSKVIGVYPQGKKQICKVTFKDKTSTECCNDHLWSVKRAGGKFKILPLSSIKEKLFYTTSGINNSLHFIPLVEKINFEEKHPKILHPYVLGILLGDGMLSQKSASFANTEGDLPQEVEPFLTDNYKLSKWKGGGYNIIPKEGTNEVTKLLTELGLNVRAEKKFIPNSYLFNTYSNRLYLLQGLLDTDGEVGKDGDSVAFSSSSIELTKGVQFLVQSLGGTATYSRFPSFLNGKQYLDSHSLYISAIHLPLFRRGRKKTRWESKNQKSYPPSRAIKRIEEVGEKEATCIAIDSPHGLYITNDFIVTHNTKVTLDILSYQKQCKNKMKALVLVPNIVHITSWESQCKEHTPNLNCVPLRPSSREDRVKMVEEEGDIYVINYAGLLTLTTDIISTTKKGGRASKLVPNQEKINYLKEKFNYIVFDESDSVGNHQSVTYKICKELTPSYTGKFGLSGRPFGRNVEKLWTQFFLVDRGQTLGTTLSIFREAFFTCKVNFWGGYEYTFKKEMESTLHKVVQNRSIRYRDDECADLPKIIYTKINVPLQDESLDYYKQIIQSLREQHSRKDALTIINNAFIAMRQALSGYVTFTDEDKEKVKFNFSTNPKLDALEELVEELPDDRKMVIFHDFIHTGEIITGLLKKMKIKHVWLYGATLDKEMVLNSFLNDNRVRIMVANSASGAKGLNLQVANYTVFFETPVDPIYRSQAEKRTHRIGQTRPVFIYDLVGVYPKAKGLTIDQKIHSYLKEGNNLFTAIIEGKDNFNDLD